MVRLRNFSSLIGDEMVIGKESDDEDASLAKQQGLKLILVVLLIDLDVGEEVFNLHYAKNCNRQHQKCVTIHI